MDSGTFLQLSCWMIILLYSSHPGLCEPSTLQVVLDHMPPLLTSGRSASFAFHFENQVGEVPCGTCTILCKLDDYPLHACVRDALYTNLPDGRHAFKVLVQATNELQASKQFNWAVYTETLTASIDAGPVFTNGQNITVNITFSAPCTRGRSFSCESASTCALRVTGAGIVLPSTLKIIQGGLKYSLVVALSSKSSTGRVNLALDKGFCTDAAGNSFRRSPNSTVTVHFDRRPVTVNLWTAIAATQVQISNLSRTVQATNKLVDLIIYLDFTQPVQNSSNDLLNALKATGGTFKATPRKSHGNRRFGFLLINVTPVAVVSVSFETGHILGRAGTIVTPPSAITFLYDSVRPEAKLTTSSSAKTRDRNVQILAKFTKPVFSFGSQALTISGGRITRQY